MKRAGLPVFVLSIAMLAAAPAAWAQDQPPGPETCGGPGPTADVYVGLGGRPGVPSGFRGGAFVPVPMGGQPCPPPPPRLPADVLHGFAPDPVHGDVLHGPPGDVLAGPPGTPYQGQ